MQLAPTPRDTLVRDGSASLLHFRGPEGAPVFVVPSVINRWYVLDLRPGASLVGALVEAGLSVYLLDWGVPEDEDRYLTWDALVRRYERLFVRARAHAGVDCCGVLGYCMGATLSGIVAARNVSKVGALVNLAGPFDFSQAGHLAAMTDSRWFDADAIADAGNLPAAQMQSGFQMLRPTQELAKRVGQLDRGFDPAGREAFEALEAWASDNIPFPAEAYRRYIKDLYQQNQLVRGEHWVVGERVDLGAITCPVLTIVADRDAICPPQTAVALNSKVGSRETEVLQVAGGHVGAVVGSRAVKELYPKIAAFFRKNADASRKLAG